MLCYYKAIHQSAHEMVQTSPICELIVWKKLCGLTVKGQYKPSMKNKTPQDRNIGKQQISVEHAIWTVLVFLIKSLTFSEAHNQ